MQNRSVKLFLSIIFICFSTTYATSENLSEDQKIQVRRVVQNFCHKSELFCSSTNQDQTELVKMFSGKFTDQVLNDVSDNTEYIGIAQYLLGINAEDIKITYKENISQLEVLDFKQPNDDNSSSEEHLFAQIIVTKRITSQFINKEVKNCIIINVHDKKIFGILRPDPPDVNLAPIEMWYKGIKEFDFARQYAPSAYKTARDWFQKSAEKGFAQAQNDLGNMYYFGYGGVQSCEEAIKWFTMSDLQGNSEGSQLLGNLYYRGGCIKKDFKKAYVYLSKAPNDKYALITLGVMYANGEGVKKDTKKAIQLFERCLELLSPKTYNDDDSYMQYEINNFLKELKNQ
jgi:hypothetical protein